MQGLRLIDCQSLLASVRMGARCADCSSPLEVRGKLDLGFLGGVGQTSLLLTFWRALWGSINLVTLHLFFAFLNSDEKICSSSFH